MPVGKALPGAALTALMFAGCATLEPPSPPDPPTAAMPMADPAWTLIPGYPDDAPAAIIEVDGVELATIQGRPIPVGVRRVRVPPAEAMPVQFVCSGVRDGGVGRETLAVAAGRTYLIRGSRIQDACLPTLEVSP